MKPRLQTIVLGLFMGGLSLSGTSAQAGAPLLGASVRLPASPEAAVVISSAGLGVAGALSATPTSTWNGELVYQPRNALLDVRAGRSWRLTRPERLFSATAELTGTVLATTRGPFVAGLGPHAGIHAGLGRERWQVLAGLTAGAELFTDGGPRLPVRLEAGAGAQVGSVRLLGVARVGQDIEPGHATILRAEAGLVLGWRWR